MTGWRSDLFALFVEPFKDGLVGRSAEATGLPCFLVVLISITESLSAEIKCVAKWFVNADQGIAPSHEDLESLVS